MARLHLLRHAKSDWTRGLPDFDRPLNPRGERSAALIAEHCAASGVQPGLILCSPAARTRATIAPLLEALDPVPRVDYEDAIYGGGAATLLDLIQRTPAGVEELMLVGHNPPIGALAAELAGPEAGPSGIAAKYPTGALASFDLDGEWAQLWPGQVRLLEFVRPRQLGGD